MIKKIVCNNLSSFNNNSNILNLSKQFLISIKNNESEFGNHLYLNLDKLQDIKYCTFKDELNNDNNKKTFWINIYNSFIKLRIKDKKTRSLYPKPEFFKTEDILISDLKLSFDDIEHTILRRSKMKNEGENNLQIKFTIPQWETELRVDKLDYRIHFALNCGAAGCPRILAYDEEEIEIQLEIAKKAFLKNNSTFDDQTYELKVSKIFNWFIGDFGGESGIIQIHKNLGIIPNELINDKVKIIFNDYNWEIADSDDIEV